jgi:hypothetical protein
MNIPWGHIVEGLAGLTTNPATAAVFRILAVAGSAAAQASGANEIIDKVQAEVNSLVDSVQAGVLPQLRPDEPRHVAAVELATQGTPVPDDVPRVTPPPPAGEPAA